MYLKHVHDVQVWKILTKYKIKIYCSTFWTKQDGYLAIYDQQNYGQCVFVIFLYNCEYDEIVSIYYHVQRFEVLYTI